VRAGQLQQICKRARNIGPDQCQYVHAHQCQRRVNQVLGAAAIADESSRLRVEQRHRFSQVTQQRRGQASDASAFPGQLGHIKQFHLAGPDDGLGCTRRDQADAGLCTRQRGLETQYCSKKAAIAQNIRHLRGAQDTLENTHVLSPDFQRAN